MTAKQTPDNDTFEYQLWHLLSRYPISSTAQTAIGREVIKLANEFLGIKPDTEPPRDYSRKYVLGDAIHYLPPGDQFSRCGRAERKRLRANRITDDPRKATCGHCKRWAKLDSANGLIKLDSSENS